MEAFRQAFPPVVADEEYDKILLKLDQVLKLLTESLKKSKNSLENQWLDTSEVARALKVSSRTLQNYRDNRILPSSKIGSKIYFKASDIESLLTEHYSK